jgi:hypothetical protein
MHKIKIKLVSLGNLKCKVDFSYIENWKSEIFKIEPRSIVGALPNRNNLAGGYTDNELQGLIRPDSDCDITIGIINAQIQDNFYARPLGANTSVCSLYEMNEIIVQAEHRIEHFVLRCIYTNIVAFILCDKNLDMQRVIELAHDEVRNCLFDLNMEKTDIVYSLDPPTLCNQCRTKLSRKQLEGPFVSLLDSEMKRIRKGLYFRVSDWAKNHPISALLITAAFGLILNVAGNYLYEGGKSLWNHRGNRQTITSGTLGVGNSGQTNKSPQ